MQELIIKYAPSLRGCSCRYCEEFNALEASSQASLMAPPAPLPLPLPAPPAGTGGGRGGGRGRGRGRGLTAKAKKGAKGPKAKAKPTAKKKHLPNADAAMVASALVSLEADDDHDEIDADEDFPDFNEEPPVPAVPTPVPEDEEEHGTADATTGKSKKTRPYGYFDDVTNVCDDAYKSLTVEPSLAERFSIDSQIVKMALVFLWKGSLCYRGVTLDKYTVLRDSIPRIIERFFAVQADADGAEKNKKSASALSKELLEAVRTHCKFAGEETPKDIALRKAQTIKKSEHFTELSTYLSTNPSCFPVKFRSAVAKAAGLCFPELRAHLATPCAIELIADEKNHPEKSALWRSIFEVIFPRICEVFNPAWVELLLDMNEIICEAGFIPDALQFLLGTNANKLEYLMLARTEITLEVEVAGVPRWVIASSGNRRHSSIQQCTVATEANIILFSTSQSPYISV